MTRATIKAVKHIAIFSPSLSTMGPDGIVEEVERKREIQHREGRQLIA